MTAGVLQDRAAIITGANQGLGREIARAYVSAGANVVLCARDERLLDETGTELLALASRRSGVVSIKADVSSNEDIRRVVTVAVQEFSRIDILVNNAAVYGPKGTIDEVEWDEWIDAIEINLIGSVRFAREVIPHFKEQRYGKIIQLSGGGATNPLPKISAYAASKAAIVRYAETLALELKGFNIDVNSIAPGALNTRLLDEVIEAGPDKIGENFYVRSQKQRAQGGTPMEIPARLAVFLGSAASDGITGKLISAVWDDWENFPRHLEELKSSDVYTLRRIVAKDRGFKWGDK